MKYLYTGKFEELESLGFIQNLYKTFWFLPSEKNQYNCLTVCVNREIEFFYINPEILKDKYKIVKD